MILILLLFSSISTAEVSFFKGDGVLHKTEETKLYGFQYSEQTSITGLERGLMFSHWQDSHGATSFVGINAGPKVYLLQTKEYDPKTASGLYLELKVGVGFILGNDRFLASHFEFFQLFCMGVDYVGFCFKHVSNAGLRQPNIGRNFLFLEFNIGGEND